LAKPKLNEVKVNSRNVSAESRSLVHRGLSAERYVVHSARASIQQKVDFEAFRGKATRLSDVA